MIDFNSSSSVSGQVMALVDAGLQEARARETERQYLGASRLGAACERALQYEYAKAPVDYGRNIEGRMLRIFERGHVIEDCMVTWLRGAGFDLRTRKANGEQFGFTAANGRLQGHVDGVIVGGPEGFAYPALWENKCLGVQVLARPAKRIASRSRSRSMPHRWRSIRPTSNCTSTRRSSRPSTPTRWRSTPSSCPSTALSPNACPTGQPR